MPTIKRKTARHRPAGQRQNYRPHITKAEREHTPPELAKDAAFRYMAREIDRTHGITGDQP